MEQEKTSFLTIFIAFFKVGLFTFGGGYAMIALLDSECVEKRKWLKTDEFLNIIGIAESTPGPVAINCATYTGYKLRGLWGAITSTLAIIFPSILILYTISLYFEDMLSNPLIAHIFKGINVAVAILIFQAGWKMFKQTYKASKIHIFSLCFISVIFFISLMWDLFEVSLSTIHLIILSGIFAYFFYKPQTIKQDTRDK